MKILAIDPGSEQSAWLRFEGGRPQDFSIDPNDNVLRGLRLGWLNADVVVIEQIRSYGMPVGAEVFDTVYWSGRFAEACHPTPVALLPRKKVCVAICGSAQAKDANIHAALMDRFGGSKAKGTKAAPGPLYGIAKDLWSALAVAVAYSEGVR